MEWERSCNMKVTCFTVVHMEREASCREMPAGITVPAYRSYWGRSNLNILMVEEVIMRFKLSEAIMEIP